jgi:hypothetical protein
LNSTIDWAFNQGKKWSKLVNMRVLAYRGVLAMYRFIDLNHIAILSRIDHLNRDLPDLHLAGRPGKEDIRTAREIPNSDSRSFLASSAFNSRNEV